MSLKSACKVVLCIGAQCLTEACALRRDPRLGETAVRIAHDTVTASLGSDWMQFQQTLSYANNSDEVRLLRPCTYHIERIEADQWHDVFTNICIGKDRVDTVAAGAVLTIPLTVRALINCVRCEPLWRGPRSGIVRFVLDIRPMGAQDQVPLPQVDRAARTSEPFVLLTP